MKLRIKESNYGGSFDIDPEQYFTRDEINEYAEAIAEQLSLDTGETIVLESCYIEDNKYEVCVELVDDGSTFETSTVIDMRKIRKPSDLMLKYNPIIFSNLKRHILNYISYWYVLRTFDNISGEIFMKLTIKETNNDSNYKEQSIELLKQVEWIDVDMNLKDSEPDIRSFCMNLYNTLVENLTIVYYNKWYALKLQENVRLFFSFNKSSTYTIQFLNGKQVSVTKTRSNVNKVWYTEFDKYKFINLYLEDDN